MHDSVREEGIRFLPSAFVTNDSSTTSAILDWAKCIIEPGDRRLYTAEKSQALSDAQPFIGGTITSNNSWLNGQKSYSLVLHPLGHGDLLADPAKTGQLPATKMPSPWLCGNLAESNARSLRSTDCSTRICASA
jgi:hypothetical protein